MNSYRSYLLPLSLFVGVPLVASPSLAQACSGGDPLFSVLSSELLSGETTGVRFLTVSDGDAHVARNPKFLVGTNQGDLALEPTLPAFTLSRGEEQVPLKVEATASASRPRKISLFVLTPQSALSAGEPYTLTASIGKPASVRFTVSEQVATQPAPSSAKLSSFTFSRSENIGPTCYPPPYFFGSYAWEAAEGAAVVAYETDEAGKKLGVLGAWRGSGSDKLMLAAGMRAAAPGSKSCVALETYAPDLAVVATPPVCALHGHPAPVEADGGAGDDGGAAAPGGDGGAGKGTGAGPSPDGGSGNEAAGAPMPAAGGCSMSPASAGQSSWSVLGMLAALWLRRKLRRADEASRR